MSLIIKLDKVKIRSNYLPSCWQLERTEEEENKRELERINYNKKLREEFKESRIVKEFENQEKEKEEENDKNQP